MTLSDPTQPHPPGGNEWIAIAAGGALGALLRFGFAHAVETHSNLNLWVATAASNLVGALILGYLLARLGESSSPLLRPFLATGLLGSFTTFSTLLLENLAFAENSQGEALLHLVGVIGLGVVGFSLGESLGRRRDFRVSP